VGCRLKKRVEIDTLKTLSVKAACKKLPELVDEALMNYEPLLISGINNNVVLDTENNWWDMKEALH